MLRSILTAAVAAILVMLDTSAQAHAWGAYHAGYTHVGPNGVQHVGYTAAAGPGGVYGGAHYGAAGYGGAYGGAHYGAVGYGGAAYGYRGGYAYSPSAYSGVQAHGTYYLR
jgi:hypothetical protein